MTSRCVRESQTPDPRISSTRRMGGGDAGLLLDGHRHRHRHRSGGDGAAWAFGLGGPQATAGRRGLSIVLSAGGSGNPNGLLQNHPRPLPPPPSFFTGTNGARVSDVSDVTRGQRFSMAAKKAATPSPTSDSLGGLLVLGGDGGGLGRHHGGGGGRPGIGDGGGRGGGLGGTAGKGGNGPKANDATFFH